MKKFNLATGFLLLILFISITSCMTREYPVVETYYETQYKTEPYEETETIVAPISGVNELQPKSDYALAPRIGGGEVIRWLVFVPRIHKTSNIEVAVPVCPYGCWMEAHDLSEGDPTGVRVWVKDYYILPPGPLLDQAWTSEGLKFDASTVTLFEVALFDRRGNYTAKTILKDVKLTVKQIWTDERTETKTVTKERQVPYQVEKQRIVMKTKKVPIWELIFGRSEETD